jgi:predicted dithiol-disulfide oxidoreductase (DUF899 family)
LTCNGRALNTWAADNNRWIVEGGTEDMAKPKIVSEADWLKARKKLLIKEKKFLRAQDAMSAERRALPWVKVTKPALAQGTTFFNYAIQNPGNAEREGHSVFARDKRGTIFHTYSCYSRGNEPLNIHYHYLDMVPKGRDEAGRGPFWVRRHDEYNQ